MELNPTQRTFEKVLELFDRWKPLIGEPTWVNRGTVEKAKISGMVYAEWEEIYGSNVDLSLLLTAKMSQGGKVLVRVELKMLRRFPGDVSLTRFERDMAYYDRRNTTLEDARVFLYCPDYPHTFAVDWEEISGYVSRIIPFYQHFLGEEGEEERRIPIDAHSYEQYSKSEIGEIEELIRVCEQAMKNNNYRLED